MKPKKSYGRDIHQLRGWAEFMDKGMLAQPRCRRDRSYSPGATTLLSIKYDSALVSGKRWP